MAEKDPLFKDDDDKDKDAKPDKDKGTDAAVTREEFNNLTAQLDKSLGAFGTQVAEAMQRMAAKPAGDATATVDTTALPQAAQDLAQKLLEDPGTVMDGRAGRIRGQERPVDADHSDQPAES